DGESFSCRAHADGATVRIELTPVASHLGGPIERLRVGVEGAVDAADVARLAAERYSRAAAVTCPHRYWIGKPGVEERCTLHLGQLPGPLPVQSADGELAFAAPWLEGQ